MTDFYLKYKQLFLEEEYKPYYMIGKPFDPVFKPKEIVHESSSNFKNAIASQQMKMLPYAASEKFYDSSTPWEKKQEPYRRLRALPRDISPFQNDSQGLPNKALTNNRLAYSEPKRIKTEVSNKGNIFSIKNNEPAGGSKTRFYLNKSDILPENSKEKLSRAAEERLPSGSLIKYPFGTDSTPLKAHIIQRDYQSDAKREDPLRVRILRTRADNILGQNLEERANLYEYQDFLTKRKVNRALNEEFEDSLARERNDSAAPQQSRRESPLLSKNKNDFDHYSNRIEWLNKIWKKGFDITQGESDKAEKSLKEVIQRRIIAKNNKVRKMKLRELLREEMFI